MRPLNYLNHTRGGGDTTPPRLHFAPFVLGSWILVWHLPTYVVFATMWMLHIVSILLMSAIFRTFHGISPISASAEWSPRRATHRRRLVYLPNEDITMALYREWGLVGHAHVLLPAALSPIFQGGGLISFAYGLFASRISVDGGGSILPLFRPGVCESVFGYLHSGSGVVTSMPCVGLGSCSVFWVGVGIGLGGWGVFGGAGVCCFCSVPSSFSLPLRLLLC